MDFLQLQEANVFFIYIYISNTTPATSLIKYHSSYESGSPSVGSSLSQQIPRDHLVMTNIAMV